MKRLKFILENSNPSLTPEGSDHCQLKFLSGQLNVKNEDATPLKGSGLRLAFGEKDQRSAFSTFLRERILPDGRDAVFYLTVSIVKSHAGENIVNVI